jgi:hypothetical protein
MCHYVMHGIAADEPKVGIAANPVAVANDAILLSQRASKSICGCRSKFFSQSSNCLPAFTYDCGCIWNTMHLATCNEVLSGRQKVPVYQNNQGLKVYFTDQRLALCTVRGRKISGP